VTRENALKTARWRCFVAVTRAKSAMSCAKSAL
jgi:hypothetical protein